MQRHLYRRIEDNTLPNTQIPHSSENFDTSHYPKTYIISPGWKIAMLTLYAVLGIPSLLGLLYFSTAQEMHGALHQFICSAICVGFLLLSIYGALSALRTRVTLQADGIEYRDLFSTRSMHRHQIKNWRGLSVHGVTYLELVAFDPAVKKLKIAILFKPDTPFDDWFADLPNADRDAPRFAEQEIQNNLALGLTPAERAGKAARARKIARIANLAMLALCVLVIVYPRPYLLSICLALPWIAIAAAWKGNGFYTVGDSGKSTLKGDLTLLCIMPGILLALRALLDVNTLAWTQAIGPGVIVGLLMTAMVGRTTDGFSKRSPMAILYAIFLATYAIAGIILGNALFDRSVPSVYPVKILARHHTTGKGATFYFSVAPWGPRIAINDIVVRPAFYRTKEPGDVICVRQHGGAFRMPWYAGEDCKPAEIPAALASGSTATKSQSHAEPQIAVSAAASGLGDVSKTDANDASQLLKTGRYEVLESRFSALQQRYKDHKIDDLALLLAYRDFYDTDPALELRHAEWIKAYPHSYAAYLAEAIYFIHIGREARGNKYADETSDQQFAAMEAVNSKAFIDLQESLKLDDRPILSYVQLIDLDRHENADSSANATSYLDRLSASFFHKKNLSAESLNAARDYLDRSISIAPENFIARRKYMTILETRWGHSTSEMKAFFKESRSAGLTPAKLRVLAALVAWDQAWNEERRDDIQASGKSYAAAVALVGDDGDLMEQNMFALLLSDAGHIHEELRQYDLAKGYYQKSVESNPGSANAWSNLGICQVHTGDMEGAAVSYRKAAEMGEPIAQNEWGKFLWNGTAVKADHAAAIGYFEKSASQGIADAQNNLRFAKQK